jgi:hypothetical protein
LRDMSLPNMPVKPASITAKCNTKYDFFIKSYLQSKKGQELINKCRYAILIACK